MGWEHRIAGLCKFVGATLPPRLSYAVAESLASGLHALSPPLRADAESSAAYMLGEARESREVARAARRSMRNYARDVVDLLRYNGRPADADTTVSFEGLDRLDAALAEGKGVILVGLHLGSWDVGAAYLAHRGYPMSAVVLSAKDNDGLDAFMRILRTEAGVGVITTRDGIWQAADALRRNQALALLIDGATEGKSVPVRFVGGQVQFSAGPATLALRTKAAVVPACTLRLPNGRFQGFIDERVSPGPGGNLHQSIPLFTQSMLDSLQGYVEQYPDQWGMTRSIPPRA